MARYLGWAWKPDGGTVVAEKNYKTVVSDRKTERRIKARRSKYAKNSQRYIYVISDGEFIKVGFAWNVEKRLRSLQVSNARPLRVIRKIAAPSSGKSRLRDAKNTESELHKHLEEFRVSGEWFSREALSVFDEYWRGRTADG